MNDIDNLHKLYSPLAIKTGGKREKMTNYICINYPCNIFVSTKMGVGTQYVKLLNTYLCT